jgi:hypothetical protein
MAYIGKQPTPVPLTAADFADDTITEAKMANDAISLAELKAGTDGEVISWDASGNPVAIAVGTSGHFLKSQGAGSQPVFAAAGGGAWTKISTNTIVDKDDSGPTTVDFGSSLITTTYVDYMVIFTGVKPQNNNEYLELLVSIDNGSNWLTAGNYWYGTMGRGADGSTDSLESQGGTEFKIQIEGIGEDATAYGVVEMSDPMNQTSDEKHFMANWRVTSLHGASGRLNNSFGGGVYKGTVTHAYNAIRFQMNAGDFELGVFTLYGRTT